MKKAFVFGKFMPFHKGHQALIEFAAEHCDELTVLLCVSDKEKMPAALRFYWLQQTFSENNKIKIRLLEYKESELPNSSVSSMEISEIWSKKFKNLLPDIELLVSSEAYGEFVASFMNIEHIVFDPLRNKVPVSATKIRNNPYKYWDFIPDAVKPYYQRKVVILGTESSGKSTLTAYLGKKFDAALVQEAGRELIANSSNFTPEDLWYVATLHQEQTLSALKSLKYLVILDTDIHITQSYAHFSFGHYLDLPKECYETQKADLYLYLDKNAPFVQDGTRMPEDQRNLLDESHKKTLAYFSVKYELLNGSYEENADLAEKLINLMLKK